MVPFSFLCTDLHYIWSPQTLNSMYLMPKNWRLMRRSSRLTENAGSMTNENGKRRRCKGKPCSLKIARHQYRLALETKSASVISSSSQPLSQRVRAHFLRSELILRFPIASVGSSQDKYGQNVKVRSCQIRGFLVVSQNGNDVDITQKIFTDSHYIPKAL